MSGWNPHIREVCHIWKIPVVSLKHFTYKSSLTCGIYFPYSYKPLLKYLKQAFHGNGYEQYPIHM